MYKRKIWEGNGIDTVQIQDCFHNLHQPRQYRCQGKKQQQPHITQAYNIQSRMVYASSRETLKNALNGIAMNWQANDPGELEWADLLKEASKGKGTM